jgi:hypothetical protein
MASACPHCNEQIGVLSILRWASRSPTWYVECHACGKPLEYSRNSRRIAIWLSLIATAMAIPLLTYSVSLWVVVPFVAAAYIAPHFFVRFVPAQRPCAPQAGATVGGIKLPSLNSKSSETKSTNSVGQ